MTRLIRLLGLFGLIAGSAFGATIVGSLQEIEPGVPAVTVSTWKGPVFYSAGPYANGTNTILNTPRASRVTNGVFAMSLEGGRYRVDMGPQRTAVNILVPQNDTNTYQFNVAAGWATNLGTFIWTNPCPDAVTQAYVDQQDQFYAQTASDANDALFTFLMGQITNTRLAIPTNNATATDGQIIVKTGDDSMWSDNLGPAGGEEALATLGQLTAATNTLDTELRARIIEATNGVVSGGGGGSQTPILQDVDYSGFSATNLAGITIVNTGTESAHIALDGSASFAGGQATIDASGNGSFAGLSASQLNSGVVPDAQLAGAFPNFGGVTVNSGVCALNGDGSASFASGNCTIDGTTGKITATGVVDPPMYLLDRISEADALQLYVNQVPENKRTSLALFFNGTNMIAFVGSTKQKFKVPMELVGTVELPKAQPKAVRIQLARTNRTVVPKRP